MSRHASPGERGASTVFAAACLGFLLILGAALGVVAALFVDHRTAQSAADLAALAGAGAIARGQDPCVTAGQVAGRNGADLTGCRVSGREVMVTVTVAGPRWLGQVGDLRGRARAGPAEVTGAGGPSGGPGSTGTTPPASPARGRSP